MSDDIMKSALDRALERADKIEVPQEKLQEMKHKAKGDELAAAFLKDSGYPLSEQLDQLDVESRKYVVKAVEAVLLRNMSLPKREIDADRNQQVFHGLSLIKVNKDALKQVSDQLATLANYYTQAIKQNYEQLKAQVEQMMAQAMRQKTGMPPSGKMNVEHTPEFQENWRQVSANLDGEYAKALAQLKQQIIELD